MALPPGVTEDMVVLRAGLCPGLTEEMIQLLRANSIQTGNGGSGVLGWGMAPPAHLGWYRALPVQDPSASLGSQDFSIEAGER